jgi:hypothetical protein
MVGAWRLSTPPFIGTEALATGRASRRLLRNHYRAIYRNAYLANDQPVTSVNRAMAAWLWSDRQATATGLSAAALHGSRWIDATLPAELYRRNGKPVDMLRYRPHVIVERVCAALHSAGAEWPIIARVLPDRVA